MPLLRKGIIMPVKGIDFSVPSTFIDDHSGFPQNVRFFGGEVTKRPGTNAYGGAIADATQIMGMGILELPTLKYLVRASKAKLEVYDTNDDEWDSISATDFTGGDDNFFHFANVAESAMLIITNGYDSIRKYIGSGNASLLGGSPPLAKYCTYLSPYLMLAYCDDGVAVKPWMVKWCDTDDPENWTTGNSGSALLSSEPSAIQNIVKLNEYVATYKENSIYLGIKVETSDIFQFQMIKTGIGLAAPRAVVDAEGQHYFMGYTDFYAFNGVREEPIGKPIRDRIFSTLDRANMGRCFGIHVKNLQEIWFFIVISGDEWPNYIWKYNYRNGFWYYDTCNSFTSAITWKKIGTQSWDDDTPGAWDEALDWWDAADSIRDWEEIVFGNYQGRTMKVDYNTTNDLGVPVSSQLETKDYIADYLEFNKRWLQLDVWAKGSDGAKLYVDYSTDFGSNWTNIPYSSSTAYLTLTSSCQLFRLYFDIITDHIRFRFRNAEDNEIFYLRSFYPYYLAREEVKG